ncbi:MAG TPA: nuclear transport factor 2 family protein [Polyangiaceae bacterium]|nr:nuclear transport factor 2 family protein [Polyangiaceae bacterium]
MRHNQTTHRWLRGVASAAKLALSLCAVGLAAPGCADDDEPEIAPAALEGREGVAGRLDELEDRAAIGSVAACYGRGHDAIFTDLGGGQAEARAILGECFEPGVRARVFFFGAPQPTAVLEGLDGLIGFIEQFAIDSRYTSARNVPGNVEITLRPDGTATMLSSTSAPHFIAPEAGGVVPTVDVITARYVDELRRGEDGRFRTYAKDLFIDEAWRGSGQYPFAPPAGGP